MDNEWKKDRQRERNGGRSWKIGIEFDVKMLVSLSCECLSKLDF
jgi:hypothetical protein